MASDDQEHLAGTPESRRPKRRRWLRRRGEVGGSRRVRRERIAEEPTAAPEGVVLHAVGNQDGSAGEPLVGEVTGGRPIVVVTAIALKRAAREALAERLGPGHIVVDIRTAGPDADIVLIPPAGGISVGMLRRQFPQARVLATEFSDEAYGADYQGPLARILESDLDGYFMAPSIDDLARVTQDAGRVVAGALGSGGGNGAGNGERWPLGLLQANRGLLPAGSGRQEATDGASRADVTLDLDAWAGALAGDARILAELAWPLILQLLRQGLQITVLGAPTGEWNDRARAAGVQVHPSARQLDDSAPPEAATGSGQER
jgi:hypothetical protein